MRGEARLASVGAAVASNRVRAFERATPRDAASPATCAERPKRPSPLPPCVAARYSPRVTMRSCGSPRAFALACRRWVDSHPVARHWGHLFFEQLFAVLPITVLLVATMTIYFGRAVDDPGQAVGGLAAAVAGLVFFLEGMRVAIMPMAQCMGERVPRRFPLGGSLLLTFALGVLVTYAEPSIQALRPLAALVDHTRAPYLYFILHDQMEPLVFSVAAGVGVAAVLGTLRFIRGWSLKPLIGACLLPTLALTVYMHFGDPDLRPLIGLSWDCGAITTGSVTVPLLLRLGSGIVRGQRGKGGIAAAAVGTNKLEGFGVVTLASLAPILCVQILSCIIGVLYTKEQIVALAAASALTMAGAPHARSLVVPSPAEPPGATSMLDETPLKELVFSIRAVAPLSLALLLVVKLLLREPLPPMSLTSPAAAHNEQLLSAGEVLDATLADAPSTGVGSVSERRSIDVELAEVPSRSTEVPPNSTVAPAGAVACPAGEATAVGAEAESAGCAAKATVPAATLAGAQQAGLPTPACTVAELRASDGAGCGVTVVSPTSAAPATREEGAGGEPPSIKGAPLRTGACCPIHPNGASLHTSNALVFAVAVVLALVGLWLFNIGLFFGFTALGNQAGVLLPAAYIATTAEAGSPFYSPASGLAIILSVVFALGFLATRAEPALQVLSLTVQELSGGAFRGW